jgi:hypothetical protein
MRYLIDVEDYRNVEELNQVVNNAEEECYRNIPFGGIVKNINNRVNGDSISITTLKRIFRRIKGSGRLQNRICDIIASYLFQNSWATLLNHVNKVPQEILANFNLVNMKEKSSAESNVQIVPKGSNATSLLTSLVKSGDYVTVDYGNNNVLELKKSQDGLRFKVVKTSSSVLSPGYFLSIPVIFKGAHILATKITKQGNTVYDVYKSKEIVRDFRVIDSFNYVE